MMNSTANQSRQCPNCQRQMVFTPDGRGMICEICNIRQDVKRRRLSPAEIAAGQEFTLATDKSSKFRTNVRELLVQGIAAAKAGDMDEAYFYLEWLLRKEASDKDQTQAWMWLSEVYDDPADKRECLAHALAIDPTNPSARRGIAILDGRLNPKEIVDPNQLKHQVAETPLDAQAEQFQCPRCSARMNYTPDGQALLCEFCSYRQALSSDEGSARVKSEYGIGGMEQDFVAALATAKGHLQPVSMRSLQCQGCAIEFTLAPETLSVTCPYCDSVYVTETAETREIMPPQAVLPFLLNQDEAKQVLRDWFKKHKIECPRVSPIIGIYLPVWTFDVSGELSWNGLERRGDNWVPISGSHYLLNDDFLVAASKRLPPRLARTFQDFDLEHLVEYDARYLADWPAERYQIALSDASLVARKEILKELRRQPIKLTGGRNIRNLRINSRGMMVDSFKLILLPVWMTHYKVEEKVYDVIINGQTGKVRGEKAEGMVGKLFSWLRGE